MGGRWLVVGVSGLAEFQIAVIADPSQLAERDCDILRVLEIDLRKIADDLLDTASLTLVGNFGSVLDWHGAGSSFISGSSAVKVRVRDCADAFLTASSELSRRDSVAASMSANARLLMARSCAANPASRFAASVSNSAMRAPASRKPLAELPRSLPDNVTGAPTS